LFEKERPIIINEKEACDGPFLNKAMTGPRSAARFKPEVYPRIVAQK